MLGISYFVRICIAFLKDFGIPSKYLKEAIEFYHDTVQIYPLWLCPAKALDTGANKFPWLRSSSVPIKATYKFNITNQQAQFAP